MISFRGHDEVKKPPIRNALRIVIADKVARLHCLAAWVFRDEAVVQRPDAKHPGCVGQSGHMEPGSDALGWIAGAHIAKFSDEFCPRCASTALRE